MLDNNKNTPKLSVVGGGPGDPELITLKAINTLRVADVVLYDALVNEQLLEYCHPLCEKIYVGKRGHEKGITQDSINFLMVEKAYERGHVVRLKGGDPFVFGRGIEEVEYAHERGLEVNYVPGISSVFTTGNHFVPLTDRRYSDGFWVITGHKSDKSFSHDLSLAAKSNATLVFLMSMSKLQNIQEAFLDENKGEIAVCIIQNASKPNEKKAVGKVKDLLDIAEQNQLKNPAIVVVGDVVRYFDRFKEPKIETKNKASEEFQGL
jgi:uroporphyrin-III C-methyltransferase